MSAAARKRPRMSAEARKRRSEGMKKWWAAHRKAATKVVAKRARKKRTMSPEARKRLSERLKAYWAAKRKAAKKR